MVMAVSPDLACRELRPLMELVGLPIRIPYVVRGLEDLAVRQQAVVALPKTFAAAAASLVPATIQLIVQGLPTTYGLILLSGQVQIQPSIAFPLCVHLAAFDVVILYHIYLCPPYHCFQDCVANISGDDSHKRRRFNFDRL